MGQSGESRRQTRRREQLIRLIANLPPEARQALDHPVRRDILRALNDSPTPRSSTEIAAAAGPKASLNVIHYHALVLTEHGSIKVAGTQSSRGAVTRLYASNVADDQQVTSVLKVSRQLDRHER